ncbi:hypothetical protein D3C71_2098590 [compost metagenome]
METVSTELAHIPFEIVHINWYVPWVSPFTVVFGSFGLVKLAADGAPATTVHVPEPTPGVFAFRVADVTSHKI